MIKDILTYVQGLTNSNCKHKDVANIVVYIMYGRIAHYEACNNCGKLLSTRIGNVYEEEGIGSINDML